VIEAVVAAADDDGVGIVELDHGDRVVGGGLDDLIVAFLKAVALRTRVGRERVIDG
jgi:hypothetical protein